MDFLHVMKERGLLAQVTHEEELAAHLKSAPRTAYVGFDPTADSLHVGHLLPVMVLSHWQRCGHRVIALVGGGTAMVGDPTGKSEMRQMLDLPTLESNKAQFRKQLSRFLDLENSARGVLLDNAAWLEPLKYLPFLREIGVHFSVNRMLTAECFKQRLEKGLSFLEFNYMLLQSYDFLHLNRAEKCTIQLGGDDQWSNMLGGMDLIRRVTQGPAFCMTTPLFTTPDGRKMGKTEAGAVWLDSVKFSPYNYYQFWRNIEDVMVAKSLAFFTFLPMDEVRRLSALQGSEINDAKKRLAFECTSIVHGAQAAREAEEAAKALFGGGGGATGSEPTSVIPRASFGAEAAMPVLDFLVAAGVFPSKGEARRMIEGGGVTINDAKIAGIQHRVPLSELDRAEGCLVRKGKKHYHRVRLG
jgi:tyrosyl-tRNA synthetase